MDYDSMTQFLSRLTIPDLERLIKVLDEWEGEDDFQEAFRMCAAIVIKTLENNPPHPTDETD